MALNEPVRELAEQLRSSRLKNPEYRQHGIDAVPQAFCDLFAGRNFAKSIVSLRD